MSKYRLLDCGDQKKVEIFGDYKLIRPCPQALWEPFDKSLWEDADSFYEKTEGEKGSWKNAKVKDKRNKTGIPVEWEVESQDGLKWKIEPNEFGNLGVFTEHWIYAKELTEFLDKGPVLDLFSYTGSNIMALVKSGFKVTVVDSSRSAMDGFTYNMGLNKFSRQGHKLILEDCIKFISRESRRGRKYQSIIIDAPSFGRGTKGEVFKIQDSLTKLVNSSKSILEPNGKLVLTLHSPRFTPHILRIFMQQLFPNKTVETSEILNICESGAELPSGFLVKVY